MRRPGRDDDEYEVQPTMACGYFNGTLNKPRMSYAWFTRVLFPNSDVRKNSGNQEINIAQSTTKDQDPPTLEPIRYKRMAWGYFYGPLYTHSRRSERITEINIGSGDVIDWLSFSYTSDGKTYNDGRWGGGGGSNTKIVIDDNDELIGISGSYCNYIDGGVITSLTFKTRNMVCGPYGKHEKRAYSFSIELERIQSFSVWLWTTTSGLTFVSGISVQPTNYDRRMAWGYFDGTLHRPRMPSDRITKIIIRCGGCIDSLSFSYTFNGETYTGGPWGGEGGQGAEIVIDDDDELIDISGSYGPYKNYSGVIKSLTFKTKNNKVYGPYTSIERWDERSFSFSVEKDRILSFWVWTTGDNKYVSGISVQTAYDLHHPEGPYDESDEVYRKFQRVTTPDSMNFALRKAEDMQFSEAAVLRGATKLSRVSSGREFIQAELQKFHRALMNRNANWEDAGSNTAEKVCAAQLENVSNTTEKTIHTFLNEVDDRIIPFPLPVICSQRINTKAVNFYALHKLSLEIKDLKQNVANINVEDLKKNVDNINVQDLTELSNSEILPSGRQSHPGIDEAKLFGLEVFRNKIIDNFLGQSRKILVGGTVQGSAKFVLAEMIYQSSEVKDHFAYCFWIIPHISLFKTIDILRKMLLKLEIITDSLDIHSQNDLISMLNDCLKGKRCLFVIDEHWEELCTIFENIASPDGHGDNKVLIITETERNNLDDNCVLPSLETSQSLTLVRKLGKKKADSPEIRDYPRLFSGDTSLPGSVIKDDFFCHKTLLSWAGENQLFPIISRIFSQLPSSLKTCFAYTAAVFPYGSVVHATSLLRLWISEGIIPQEEGQTMDNIAKSCLQHLVQRGLLHVITTYYHNQANQPVHSVIIHLNLHHKFNMAAREKEKSGNKCTTWEKEILPVEAIRVKDDFDISNYLERSVNDPTRTRCHRLALHLPYQFSHFYPFIEGPMVQEWNCPNLHSLFFFGSVASLLCRPFTYLRVLTVFYANVQFPEEDTPCALNGLINLRYLGFIVCMVEGGSLGKALGRLTKLETLDLSDSIVSGLSDFIENNTTVTVVGPVSEELQKFWSPIPDMAQ